MGCWSQEVVALPNANTSRVLRKGLCTRTIVEAVIQVNLPLQSASCHLYKTSVLAVEHTQFVAVRNKVVTPQQIRSASRSPPSTYKSNGTGQEVRGKGQEAPVALDKIPDPGDKNAATGCYFPSRTCDRRTGNSLLADKGQSAGHLSGLLCFPLQVQGSLGSRRLSLRVSSPLLRGVKHIITALRITGSLGFPGAPLQPTMMGTKNGCTVPPQGSKCQASGLADEPHSTAAKKAVPIHGPWALKMDGRKLCFFSLGIPEDE